MWVEISADIFPIQNAKTQRRKVFFEHGKHVTNETFVSFGFQKKKRETDVSDLSDSWRDTCSEWFRYIRYIRFPFLLSNAKTQRRKVFLLNTESTKYTKICDWYWRTRAERRRGRQPKGKPRSDT